MELTILMPCLNEDETLGACITKATQYIKNSQLDAEILVADNGSTDRSAILAIEMGARVIVEQEKGYGAALIAGIANSKGDYIIMGDSDDSYDFANIQPFLFKLREGNDLVMGNRFKGGIEKGAMPFLHRYLGNPVLSFIGRLFFRIPISDFHCGLRGFNRHSIMNLDLCSTGMEFASEMVVKSAMNNLKITEVPTKLHQDGRSKSPHLRTWRDGWRHLRFLLLFCPKWLFLFPGLSLMIFGFLLTAFLLAGPIHINRITLDVHTLLYSTGMIIIGFQSVFFYLSATMYAIDKGLIKKGGKWFSFDRVFTLEKFLLIGLFFLIMGILLAIKGIQIWNDASFGSLNPSDVLRVVIPSSFLLIVGTQLIFNSFFISILKLDIKR